MLKNNEKEMLRKNRFVKVVKGDEILFTDEFKEIFIFDYKLHYVVDPNAIVFEMSAIASKSEDVLRRNDIMY